MRLLWPDMRARAELALPAAIAQLQDPEAIRDHFAIPVQATIPAATVHMRCIFKEFVLAFRHAGSGMHAGSRRKEWIKRASEMLEEWAKLFSSQLFSLARQKLWSFEV